MMNSKNSQLIFRPVYASVKSCTLIALTIALLLFGSMSVAIADYIVSGTETYDSSTMTGIVTLSNGATLNCSGQTISSSVTTSIVVASGSTATINGGGSGKVQAPISLDGTINLNALSQVTGNITGNGKVSVSDGGSTRVSLSGTNSYKGGMATDSWNGNISIYGDQSQATGGYAISSTTLNKCAEVYLKSGAKATGPLQVRGNISYASFLNIESGASYTITDSSQGVLLQQSENGGYGRNGAWVYLSGTMSNAGTLTMANAAGIDVRNGGKWTQNGKITMTNNYYHGITLNVQSGGSFTYTGTDPIVINPHSSTTTAVATTNINIAGTFETSAGFKVGVNSISGTSRATINLNGGTIKAGADIDNLITGVNTGSVATLPNLKVNSASTIDTNGHNITINTYGNSGAFSGSAQLTKKGSGTLTFSGTNSYTGVVDVQAGTLLLSGNATLGTGDVYVNGGTLLLSESVDVEIENVYVSGGTLELTDNSVLKPNQLYNTAGKINVSDNSAINAQNLYIGNELTVTSKAENPLGESVVHLTSSDAKLVLSPVAEQNLTISNKIDGNGTISKTGDGTLYLYGYKNSETDDHSVSVSSLLLQGGTAMIKGFVTGNIQVGNKNTDGEVIEFAKLSPGNSVGVLDVNGNVDVLAKSTLWFEQDATGMDQLILETGNTLTIDKDAILELTMGEVIPGAKYTIIENGSEFTGDYASDNFWNSLLTPSSNYYWNLSVDGNKVFAQIDANAVPEPSTWALLILGSFGLMWKLRSEKRETRSEKVEKR